MTGITHAIGSVFGVGGKPPPQEHTVYVQQPVKEPAQSDTADGAVNNNVRQRRSTMNQSRAVADTAKNIKKKRLLGE